jgi:hypothetical protein
VRIGRPLLLVSVWVIAASAFSALSFSQPENERYTNLYPALDALYKEASTRGVAFKKQLDAIENQGGTLIHDNPFLPERLMTAEGIRIARDLLHRANTLMDSRTSMIDRFLKDMAALIATAKVHQSDRSIAKAGFEWNREQFLRLEKLSQSAHRESYGYAARILDLCESQLGRMSLDANSNLSFQDFAAKTQFELLVSAWQAQGEKEQAANLEVRSFVANVRWTWLAAAEGY